MAFKDNLNQWH